MGTLQDSKQLINGLLDEGRTVEAISEETTISVAQLEKTANGEESFTIGECNKFWKKMMLTGSQLVLLQRIIQRRRKK